MRKAAALAKELSVHLVFGFLEMRGGKIFNTAALIAPDGRIAGRYSKSHSSSGVDLLEFGADFPVFDTPLGRIGLLICFDRQVPETARVLALKGAEMILIPAYSPDVEPINEELMMRVRSYENNVFIALANPYNTVITNPAGDIIAHNADRDFEGIVYGRFDLSQRDPERGPLFARRPGIYGELLKTR